MNIELSLEHICPDLIDIPCEVEVDYYPGSDSRENDDPPELDIIKITVLEDFEYVDKKVKYKLYKGDQIKFIDDKIKEQIYDKFTA